MLPFPSGCPYLAPGGLQGAWRLYLTPSGPVTGMLYANVCVLPNS